MTEELIAVAMLALLATSVQTSVGFGSGLIFVPAATLVIGAEPAIATMLVASPLVGVVLYALETPRTALSDVVPVAGLSLISTPLGIWLLVQSDEDMLRLLVGFAVLASVGVNQISSRGPEVQRQPQLARAAASGLAAGVMRGSTSLGGPPMVLYYHWLGGGGWRFRSRMFSSSALSGAPSLAIAAAGGVFNTDTMPAVATGFVATGAGIVLGLRLRPLVTDNRLARITMLLLLATSALAIVTASTALL